MNIKKVATIAAAAGALAAISVPAFALENEFHGMYRLRALMSNYENVGGGVLSADPKTMTVFEQRARLMYIAKASDDLKLVTHFEADSSWGDNGGANGGRGVGGGMGADSVNLETKNIYVDFNCPLTGANVKVGIQGFNDAYKGIFIADDLAGVFFSKNLSGVKATAGFARLQDGPSNASPVGQKTGDLYVLDAKYSLSKDMTVGGSYYLYRNDMIYKTQDVHMVGANAAAKLGVANVDAFAAFQAGDSSDNGKDLFAFTAQVAANAPVGPGVLSGAVLYASGDDGEDATESNAFQNPAGYVGSSSWYSAANMMILTRYLQDAMDTDKALVMTTNNSNQGLILGTVGYAAKITDKLDASANVGLALAAEKRTADNSTIGTELNARVNYKLFPNLTASLEGAYVILGDGMNSDTAGDNLLVGGVADAENPYLTALLLNYTF